MTQIKLYTGGGISLSPEDGPGRHESNYVRLVADEGCGITNGSIIAFCVDTINPEQWIDCEASIDDEEAGPEDYEQALQEMGVNFDD